MIKLTIQQKIIGALFIILSASQGAMVAIFIFQKNYLPICIPLSLIVWHYYMLANMMKWAANNHKDKLKYKVLTKEEVEAGRSSAYDYLA